MVIILILSHFIVYNKVTNFGIKWNTENLLKILKTHSVPVHKIQEKNCTTEQLFTFWKNWKKDLME